MHRIEVDTGSQAAAGIILMRITRTDGKVSYEQLVRTWPGCLIEAVEMALKNPFAHGRWGPAWFATRVDTKCG